MKKILISLFTIAIVGALIGGGVTALFFDTEEVGQNVFTAGTLDLEVGGGNPVSFTLDNMKPGDTYAASLYLLNAGTIDASKMYIKFSYTITEGTPGTVDPGTSTLDNALKLNAAQWMGGYHPIYLPGHLSFRTLSQLPTDWAGPLIHGSTIIPLHAGEEREIRLEWKLDEAADNGVQGDSVDITVHIMLEQ